MKSSIALLISLFSILELSSQNNPNFNQVDKKMSLFALTNPKKADDIAAYIRISFKTDIEKTRAAYYWLSQNITYDVPNMNTINFYENEQEIIDEAMKSHKGVCLHFATLFSRICNLAGVESFVVTGYTRQNGKVNTLGHAWNVSLVNSKWELFDPTWGTGFLQNGKFVKQLSDTYFNPKPEEFIKSHCPFDPIWQLLNYPVTNSEFIAGKIMINKTKSYFNYNDSITNYKKLAVTDQLKAANRRLKTNGIENNLLQKQYGENNTQINLHHKNEMIDLYNKAVEKFNDGVLSLNEFIDYRNKQFIPAKSDPAIRLMIERIEKSFTECQNLLNQMDYRDPGTEYSKNQLLKALDTSTDKLDEQKKFLDKYFSTSKLFRKSLFYKYTWMGIPLK